jgi:anti-sigma-K factor RskA
VADDRLGGLSCAEVLDLAPGFVLGALEPDEMDSVRQHLAACPEAHAEVLELGSVLPALLESVELAEPPAALRGRILDAARAGGPASSGATPTVTAPRRGATPTFVATPPVLAGKSAQRPRWFSGGSLRPAWVAVGLAAVLAVVALGSWNLQLRSQVDGLSAYRDGVLQVLDLAAAPGGQLAVLADPDRRTPASGIAGVGSDGRVAIVMRDLAPTAGRQVYEVWLVGADGTPLPIGGFAVGGGGTAAFTTTAAGTAEGVVVALTLEPGPGATTPTTPLVALGTAKPSS